MIMINGIELTHKEYLIKQYIGKLVMKIDAQQDIIEVLQTKYEEERDMGFFARLFRRVEGY